MADLIQVVVDAHRPTSWGNTCRCGWQGDNFSIHLVDMLRIEQVGYTTDDGYTTTRRQVPDDPGVRPVYTIGGD